MKKTKLWSVLTGIFAVLLTVVFVGEYFGNAYASMINTQLGEVTTYVVDDSTADTEYYKSSFLKADGTRDDEALTAFQKALCEQIQGEGTVMLTNDGALPVDKGIGVTVFGRGSVDTIYGGTGSGQVNTATAATMTSALTDAGFKVNTALMDWYTAKLAEMTEAGLSRSVAGMWTEYADVGSATTLAEIAAADVEASGVSYDGYTDLAIVMIGRSGGEGADLAAGEFNDGTSYFELQDVEKELLKYVAQQGFDKIVVLINSSNALAMDWVKDEAYAINAVLWIGGPGQYGLNAVAQILSGDVNPSGRLVDTYSASSLSSAAMQNFGGYTYANANSEDGTIDGVTIDAAPGDLTKVRYAIHYLVEEEGVYVGYKYYETRYEDAVLGQGNADGSAGTYASADPSAWSYTDEVVFPFGYGLSYTTFEQTLDSVTYDAASDTYIVTVTVTNTGDKAGKEVVQVYAQQPYTDFDKANGIEKAAVQLVGFGKTAELAAGASETVTVTVERKELTSYDAAVNKTYILEEGTYYLAVGASAHDAMNNILAKKGKSVADGMDADGDAAKAEEITIEATDADSYATSVTGYAVTNRFDDSDLNYYGEGLVTWLSRQDWQGTWPTSYSELTATSEMIEDLQFNYTESTSDKAITTGSTETSYTLATMIGADYDDPRWDALLDQLSLEEIGELVGHSGYKTQAIESIGLNEAVDADGPQGIKGSYGGDATMAYTSEPVMAATFNVDVLYNIGVSMGEDALRTEVVGWYGPAMNIHRTPYSGRNFEYYSEDGFLTGVLAAKEVLGAQEKGTIAFIKHFALNDQETYRQSVATFATEQAIREIYLKGFQYAVEDGGAKAVMSSFNRIGTRWAGADYDLLTEVLRKEWGFNGMVLTDAVMPNRNWMDVRIGVEAGNDAWLSSGDWLVSKIADWAKNDTKFQQNIRESAKRILYTRANSSAMNGISENAVIKHRVPTWQKALAYAKYVLLALTCLCLLLALISLGMNGESDKKGKAVALIAAVLAVVALILYVLMKSMYFDTLAAVALAGGAVLMILAALKNWMPAAILGYGAWLYAMFVFLKYEVDYRMDSFVTGDFVTNSGLFWAALCAMLVAVIFGIIASAKMAPKAKKKQ